MPNEKRIISKSKLDAIAGAIREKTGSNSTYTPDQMVAAIGAIETQGDYQEKTFTENGTYTPDAGYDAFSQVTVNVQSTGSNPLQNMLDRSSNTNGNNLFSVSDDNNIFSKLTYEDLIALDFSNKHYTSTPYMFSNCKSLTTVPQLDFSKVINSFYMFSGCTSLTTISQLDFSSVINADSMFTSCLSLTTISQLKFSKVATAIGMFFNCTSLTTIPQLGFSKVATATSMFNRCTSLTTVPQLDFSSATNTIAMFKDCTSLTTLDFSNIKTIGSQFAQNASSLSTLIIRNSTTLATLGGTNAFLNNPIASGTGYIYVPDDLVDSYKQATNWSTYAAQIKGLSELPQGE